jgi:hypothetical protein
MIDWADKRCERLVVYVNTRDGEPVPGPLRAQWLQELHPGVTVIEVRHSLETDWNDEALWERWIDLFQSHWPFPTGPDVLFSSDPYVDEIARRLHAQAMMVDPDRRAFPVSATMVRERPGENLAFLAEPVRRWIEHHWLSSSAS